MIYYCIVALILLIDRIGKNAVTDNMLPGETIPVIEDVFHFTYVQNRGAAFSLMEGQWLVLIILPMIVLCAGLVLIFLKRKKWDKLLLISIAFICGGGIGNLIDRILIGYVVDMFDFRVFPVFNIADIFICVGCGLMLLDVLLSERKKTGND